MRRPRVVGIAGGTGSGKTSLIQRLLTKQYQSHVASLSHDSYYKTSGVDRDGEGSPINWDHPDSLDNTLFIQHIDLLLNGHAVDVPIYDFKTHSRRPESFRLDPKSVILLDGILLLAIAEIRERIDLRIFIETPSDIRLLRRTRRDIESRGRTFKSVSVQYEETVRDMHETHVEPSKVYADILLPGLNISSRIVELIQAFFDLSIRSPDVCER
jgi:uridine kinase